MADNRLQQKDVAAGWQARTIPLVDREHWYRHRSFQFDFVRELCVRCPRILKFEKAII
jgi:hypothetical protein